jgi:thioredoxin
MYKNIIISLSVLVLFIAECKSPQKENEVIHINTETFKQKIFNFEQNKVWKFEGNKPAIVDFYAKWCGPCKQMSPILDEIAGEYAGRISVYKVDTDQENELAQSFGIESIPTFLLIPMKGQPTVLTGAMSKETVEKEIKDVLFKQ